MIPNDGRDFIRDQIFGDNNTVMSHMAIGTGTTAATLADTTLETEVFRKALGSTAKSAVGQLTHQITVLTSEANGNDLTEEGLFNDNSAGTMLNHKVYPVLPKTASFSVIYKLILRLKQ